MLGRGSELRSTAIAPKEIRAQLARILETRDFADYPRSAALLRYVVEETLAGRGAEIKEATIGVEVFGREPGYDSKSDSVVRTQARRVREKLGQYYSSVSEADRIRVEIPKGGYAPEFAIIAGASPKQKRIRPVSLLAAAVAVLAAIVLTLAWRREPGRGERLPAIAVLPFADRDPAHAHGALGFGLAEDLVRDFSRVRGLRVHATPAAGQLSAEARSDYPALSRRLQVDALVDGQMDGSAIRVSLIQASDSSVLWADRFAFDEPAGEIERRIEENVGRALGRTLPARASTHPENPQAHDLYFAARALWATRDADKIREAIRMYQQALAIDPDYALAYMGIADAYALMVANSQIEPKTGLPLGEAAARKALALDPSLAEAHAALGLIDGLENHPKECESEYLRAIDLNPSYDRAYARLGTYRFAQGDFPAAERLLRESERLNPYEMSLPLIRAELYYYWRRYQDSQDLIREVQKADPQNATAFQLMARDLFAEHHYEQALEFARRAAALNSVLESELIAPLQATGHTAEAARLLDRLLRVEGDEATNAYGLSLLYAKLNNREKALAELEIAVRDHVPDIESARWDPALDLIRGDARYKAAIAKLDENPPAKIASRAAP